MATNNYYQVLEVPSNATRKEIKSKFYELSLKYHPDKNKNESSHAKFLQINEAYSVLSNSFKRKEYDREANVSASMHSTTNNNHQWSSRIYRETLNPDDWILYRRPGRQTPGFDYKTHQREHYRDCIHLID